MRYRTLSFLINIFFKYPFKQNGERKESTKPLAILFDTVGSAVLSSPVSWFLVKLSSIENLIFFGH